MSIRVLIADDQSLVRAGFRLVLENHPALEVVGEASNGHEAIHSTSRFDPDVVLMDIRMPQLDGIAATREITTRYQARVLVLTTYDLDGIRAVAAGEALLAPTVTRRLIERFIRTAPADSPPAGLRDLTPREIEVLTLAARGRSNSEIAAGLVLSEATVKTHIKHVLAKLGARDRVQAVIAAYDAGLVRPA